MPKALSIEEKVAKVEAKQEIARTRSQRDKRASFNGTEGKLRVGHQIPNFHLHIFNDAPGRIAQALDVGYEFVKPEEVGGVSVNVVDRNTDIGDKVRFLVGTGEKGDAQYGYLMKIRQEFYDEDQATSQAKNDKIDEAIRGGKMTKDGHSSEGFYDAGIKMSKG
ncbi:MAG: hypothetical protein NUV97_03530 [archaeon]|nr:hypothetical protein [archaeon]